MLFSIEVLTGTSCRALEAQQVIFIKVSIKKTIDSGALELMRPETIFHYCLYEEIIDFDAQELWKLQNSFS